MPLRLSGSTGVSGIDGTAQAPAVQGSNPNAGIYYSGNNVIVSTSGNTALTVGPSGNVAISNSFSISGQYVTPYSGMMKNRIINGDFRIDQRFAGAANNNITGSQYVVDRWYSYAGGGPAPGKLRYQQNNTNGPGSSATQIATGFPNYFGANVVSSNTVNGPDQWSMSQVIEGLNISDLAWGTSNAAPVTLSFWVYSSIAGTHGASILNKGVGRSYPFTYSVTTANTWQYQTITIPGDTTGSWLSNNDVGMYVVYPMGAGSDYNGTNNTWNSGNKYPTGTVNVVSNANGSFYLTGVQLEKGSQATPFDFRHYTTELHLCQRYFLSYPYATGTWGDFSAWTYTSTQVRVTVPCVPMRTTPVIIFSGNAPVYNDGIGNYTMSSPIVINSNYNVPSFVFYATIPTATAQRPGGVFAGNGTGAFWISAELGVQN